MNRNSKILVIGAGIAGPAVCYWLKKYVFNPTLIVKKQTIKNGGTRHRHSWYCGRPADLALTELECLVDYCSSL